MSAPRIALVIHSMTPGGAERATANMANFWTRGGHAVAVVSLDSGAGEFYELDARIERVALDVAGASPGPLGALAANLRRVRALRACLRRFRPDVVIGMMNTSALLCAAATAGMRCTTIGAERTWPARGDADPFWRLARRYGYRWLDAVVAQTDAASDWLRAHTRARRIVTIPNPLTWPIPSTPPALQPDALVAPGRRLLLAVGRHEPVKGFDTLLDAFARVADAHPDWDLAILGDGSLREALAAAATERGLGARVRLPGQAGNVAQWYARADLFALSSLAEGFPNALLEAMASGCAVVATRCQAGPADLVRDGIDGRLVPPGDPAAMAATLDELMRDEGLRARLATRALDTRKRFAEHVVIAQWERLFDRRIPTAGNPT